MKESEQEQFLTWLVKELKPISTEDPEVLAQYVEALVNDDDSNMEEVKKKCKTELEDFLFQETDNFVNKLFIVLENGSYKQEAPPVQDDNEESNDNVDDSFTEVYPPSNRRRQSSTSNFDEDDDDESEYHRRRRYNDDDSFDDGSNKRQR